MGCVIACLINAYTLLFWQFHSHWYLHFSCACWLVGTFGSVNASQAGNQTPMPPGYASFDQVQKFEFFFAKPATHSLSQMASLILTPQVKPKETHIPKYSNSDEFRFPFLRCFNVRTFGSRPYLAHWALISILEKSTEAMAKADCSN